MSTMADTILQPAWLIANAERLQQCFPEEWTPLSSFNAFTAGTALREAGVAWETDSELAGVLVVLQHVGIMRLARGRKPFDVITIDFVRRGPLIVRNES